MVEVLTTIFRAGAVGPVGPARLIQRGLSRQSSCSLMDEAPATLWRSARGRCSFFRPRSEKQRPAGTSAVNNANTAGPEAHLHASTAPSIVERLQRGRPLCRGGGAEDACGHAWTPASIVLRVLHLPPRRSAFLDTLAAGASRAPAEGDQRAARLTKRTFRIWPYRHHHRVLPGLGLGV